MEFGVMLAAKWDCKDVMGFCSHATLSPAN
jgi:hypothetical protein